MSAKHLAILVGLAALLLLAARSSLAAPTESPLPNKFLYNIGASQPVAAFHDPHGLAVAANGDIYVADPANARILRFAANHQFILTWGGRGDGDGQFGRPYSIAIGPDNTVYVADGERNDIQRFTPNGALLNRWGGTEQGSCRFPNAYYPFGLVDIAVAADGTVYAAHADSEHIMRFSAAGACLGTWAMRDRDGRRLSPRAVAAGPDGRVYALVTNPWPDEINEVLVFTAAGGYLGQWGGEGQDPGQIDSAQDIVIGPDGKVYVILGDNYNALIFSPEGAYLGEMPNIGSAEGIAAAPDGTFYILLSFLDRIVHVASNGAKLDEWTSPPVVDGELASPQPLALGPDDSVYTANNLNGSNFNSKSILHYDPDGRFLGWWNGVDSGGYFGYPVWGGFSVTPEGVIYAADTSGNDIQVFNPAGALLGKWGSQGNTDGLFNSPADVAVAPDGTVYVADKWNNRVQRFSASGQFLGKWGSVGRQDGEFIDPNGIAVSPGQVVYVADTSNHRIQRFTADGQYLNQWTAGTPLDVAVGPDGTVYVADADNNCILRYTADGRYLGQWGSAGSGEGQFSYLRSVAVASDGRVYAADSGNQRIQVFGATLPPTWRAEYYANRWLAERAQVITQTPAIAFDWGTSAPDPALPADNFSARFTRTVVFDPGFYRFDVTGMGGARLWVDGRLLVDTWDGPTVAGSGFADLHAGEHFLQLEYNDAGGVARVRLTWQPLALSPRLSLPLIESAGP